jgi:hypothetical protein
VAEARALLWGVRAAFKVWTPPREGGTIFLRSDNQGVINALASRSRLIPEVSEILRLVPTRVRLNLKHVPGHGKAGNTTAAWVNDRVDQASHLRGATGQQRLREEDP